MTRRRPKRPSPVEGQILAFPANQQPEASPSTWPARRGVWAQKRTRIRPQTLRFGGPDAPNYAGGRATGADDASDAGATAPRLFAAERPNSSSTAHFEAMEQLGEMLEDYGDKTRGAEMYRPRPRSRSAI